MNKHVRTRQNVKFILDSPYTNILKFNNSKSKLDKHIFSFTVNINYIQSHKMSDKSAGKLEVGRKNLYMKFPCSRQFVCSG